MAQKSTFEPGKPVDFQIRIHVIEARDLQSRDSNGMSDPVVFVTVLNKKKHTITQKKTTTCTWDHLMFFEFNMMPEELLHGKVNFSVFDANTIARNVLIGSYELDLSTIYEKPGHEIYRTWVALTDKTGRYTGLQGYLRVSVAVLGPKDQAVAHEETEEQEASGETLQTMILMPPNIKAQEASLDINVYKAEGLPKMDTFGKCDGFVGVTFGGSEEIKTEVIKKEFNPMWLECLCIPITLPTMSDLIRFQVKDWDQGAKDDMVGTTFLKLSDITSNKVNWKTPCWVNIYGTPEGASGEMADKMNDGHLEGTSFRGRVLVSMDIRAATAPKLEKHRINAPADPPSDRYVLRMDVMEATELPSKSDVYVEVAIGNSTQKVKKAKVENGNASWHESMQDLVVTLPADKTQIPDIFVNVYSKSDKRIGFIRLNASEVSTKGTIVWSALQPDIFSGSDSQQVGGFLQYKLEFGLEKQMTARSSAITKPTLKKYQLRAFIYQGKELPAGDKEGTSDPYCVVRLGKYSQKTKTLKSTLFPVWYETLTIPVELPTQLENAPDIQVQVYDWDMVGGDDFLGRFSVPVSTVTDKFPELPAWYPLYAKDPSMREGSILASFQLIPEEQAASIPMPNITPKFKDCILEVSIVGLRDLLPYHLLPISKPFVEFDCGTEAKVRTKISDQPSGSNPNYLEVLTLPVKIPENRLFCPPINMRVYDDRLITKPLVATRSIATTPFIPWVQKDESDIAALKENIPPSVDKIPGASVLANQEPEKKPELEIVVDGKTNEKEKLKLLQKENKDLSTLSDQLQNTTQGRTLPPTKESYPEGTEPEKEPDQRDIVKHELEQDFNDPPFLLYKLYRAKKHHGRPVTVEVGEFKGRFRVLEANNRSQEPTVDLATMYKPTEYIVRVYCLEGFQLVPKDLDGNNPYIRISNGKTKIKDSQSAKQKTSRPQFFKCYEVPCLFPAQTILDVAVWDWDPVNDELIGSTRIDLESRFYNKQWKSLKKKPIEYRTLWNPSSTNAQGQLKLWIDILTPEEAKSTPPEDISIPESTEYELRVIVWNTRNVILKDSGKSSDIFVTGYPEGQDPQPTETHWKCTDGAGIFNWRLKYPLILPAQFNTFKLQVWDRNAINANEVICEANLNLKSFFTKAVKKRSVREILPKQWIAMTHPTATGIQGEVQVSFELLVKEEAIRNPAGFGRSEPNLNPTLAEPKRPETSIAPWDVKNQTALAVKNVKGWWGGFRIKLMAAGICLLIFIILVILWKIFRFF